MTNIRVSGNVEKSMTELESMAVEMPEVAGHPNRAAFRGVLTVVDVASQRAPSGSKGHRVMLTRAAAEAALPSLLGMALDYAPSFDRHDQQRKVGVITSAEIVGRNLEVGGFLYAKDFPEIVEEIAKGGRRERGLSTLAQKSRTERKIEISGSAESHGRALLDEGARLRASLAAAVEKIRSLAGAARSSVAHAEAAGLGAGALGMSYEVADVQVSDMRMRVWTLTRVTFTGAAVLRRDKAAYEDTWIELCS
jgi:hypothetical protein